MTISGDRRSFRVVPIAVLDRAFEALANPHRRAIVDRLASGPLTTPELGRTFDTAVSRVCPEWPSRTMPPDCVLRAPTDEVTSPCPASDTFACTSSSRSC